MTFLELMPPLSSVLNFQGQARPRRRKSQPGANLAILCMLGVLILGFVGICMYGGMQAYVEGDLQKAAMNSAMAGAAAYYSKVDASGSPTPNADMAKNVATNAFNATVKSTSLNGFNVTLNGVTNNDSNDSVTVDAKATIGLPFLSMVGVQQLEVTSVATAGALRYEPTLTTGPISILPVAGNINSYSSTMKLAFPLVDGPGTDLYVEQDAAMQQPYIVEACNDTSCYNVVSGATAVGTSQILTLPDGTLAIVGTAAIDLVRAGVHKASSLRFTHGNVFDTWTSGVQNPPPTTATPTVVRRVILFGYASACADKDTCYLPAGFVPVR
jgi:hypothetical protein